VILVLASGSPYRRKLISQLQIPFEWANPQFDEGPLKGWGLEPRELATRLALEKAKSLQGRYGNAAIIGSDQLVSLGSEILGKPGTIKNAETQLGQLSGKTHELITSFVILREEEVITHTETTKITLRNLSLNEIERYVAKDQPLDCSGSYRVESLGISLFEKMEGEDPSAIQGLPMIALSRELRGLGIQIP